MRRLWDFFRVVCVLLVVVEGCLFLFFPSSFAYAVATVESSRRPNVIPLGTGDGRETLVPETIQEASRAVVLIKVESANGDSRIRFHKFQAPEGIGSGVAVDPHHIITAFHVVDSATSTLTGTYNFAEITVESNGRSYKAVPVAFDGVLDLAVLRVGEELPSYAEINTAWSSWYDAGNFYAVGFFPQGKDTLHKCLYMSNRSVGSASEAYFILPVEALNFKGFSGGPIFDDQGRVLGIMTNSYGGMGNYQLRGTSGHAVQLLLSTALR